MRVYIETNFLMSIATGGDFQAYNLLRNPPSSVCIAIPSICYVKALSVLEDELKHRKRFEEELKLQISHLQRDVTSNNAQFLLPYLEQSIVKNRGLFNDFQIRLFQAFDQLSLKVQMIALTTEMLRESLDTNFSEKDYTDNLILYCILQDALSHPSEIKVFISGNQKEFDTPEILTYLKLSGVVKYFTCTQSFLDWFNSKSNS